MRMRMRQVSCALDGHYGMLNREVSPVRGAGGIPVPWPCLHCLSSTSTYARHMRHDHSSLFCVRTAGGGTTPRPEAVRMGGPVGGLREYGCSSVNVILWLFSFGLPLSAVPYRMGGVSARGADDRAATFYTAVESLLCMCVNAACAVCRPPGALHTRLVPAVRQLHVTCRMRLRMPTCMSPVPHVPNRSSNKHRAYRMSMCSHASFRHRPSNKHCFNVPMFICSYVSYTWPTDVPEGAVPSVLLLCFLCVILFCRRTRRWCSPSSFPSNRH